MTKVAGAWGYSPPLLSFKAYIHVRDPRMFLDVNNDNSSVSLYKIILIIKKNCVINGKINVF